MTLILGFIGAGEVPAALISIGNGWNVYLFLAGILLFAEVARCQGVFHWLATLALRAVGESQFWLFTLFFIVGIIVTALLSNDMTAVVLTIAVCTALSDTNVSALPYVYACAFVANAGSFLLPISNPANLLVFDGRVPLLGEWLSRFMLPSIAAILLTYVSLLVLFRRPLAAPLLRSAIERPLSLAGRAAALMLVFSVCALLTANALGISLGITAASCGVLAVLVVTLFDSRTPVHALKHVAWGIIPLVAGLFVIVGMLDRTGLLRSAYHGLQTIAAMPPHEGTLLAAAIAAAASNVFNNLPVALFAGYLHAGALSRSVTDATLVAVDLGPNLSVGGSLATILWLLIVRRAGLPITPWQFFCLGIPVCLPALASAIACIR